jgi:hypothetical protein
MVWVMARLNRCEILQNFELLPLLVRYIRDLHPHQALIRIIRMCSRFDDQSSLWSQFCLLHDELLQFFMVKPAADMVWYASQGVFRFFFEKMSDLWVYFKLSKYGPGSCCRLHELSCHYFTAVPHQEFAHVHLSAQCIIRESRARYR